MAVSILCPVHAQGRAHPGLNSRGGHREQLSSRLSAGNEAEL